MHAVFLRPIFPILELVLTQSLSFSRKKISCCEWWYMLVICLPLRTGRLSEVQGQIGLSEFQVSQVYILTPSSKLINKRNVFVFYFY